jgi:hypothetical protein
MTLLLTDSRLFLLTILNDDNLQAVQHILDRNNHFNYYYILKL